MFDYTKLNTARPPHIYLARPGGDKIGRLNGIESARLHISLRDLWSIDFEVDKYINGQLNPLYDRLTPLMELFVDGLGWFRINTLPEEIQEDGRIYKRFTAYGIETQLSDCEIPMLYINNGTEESMEMFEENTGALGRPRRTIRMYVQHENEDPTSSDYWGLGLINILMHRYFSAKGWSVGTIDLSLCSMTRTFDIDAVDGYSFLMSDASNAFSCIFVFDRIAKTISAYPTKDFGKSLNIECSFRNLLDSVHIKDKRDNIYTKFRVQGANADTEITYVNFGRDYITNLSYVLSPPDYPQTLIDKYNAYLAYCERRRKEYADTWTQYLGLQAQKSALLNRMPIDAVTSQWNAYELADLTVELEKFKAMQKALEDIYASGNIENSPDYALYMSIKTVIIPDIEAEIKRQQSQTSEPAEKTDYTFNWELYGINGLKERRRTCENSANALKERGYGVPWSESSKTLKTNHDRQYADYVKMSDAIKAIDARLEKLQSQVDTLDTQLNACSDTRSQIVKAVDISHPDFGFTQSELAAMELLVIETDYVDKAIEVLDDADVTEKIERAWELLKSAQDELEIECRPQTSFDVSLDNIYRIPAFQKEAGRLCPGDFLHMELDGGFKTRQRIIEMDLELADFNNTDLSFTFSDMTNAYGRIDDLRFLADNANASSKSTITNDQKKYVNDTAVSAANNVLSQYFGGGVSFFPNGIPKEDVIKLSDALSGLVDGNLTLDELKVKLAQVESLNADSAFIHYLESQFLVGNQAEFKSLTAELAQIKGAILGDFSAAQGTVVNLTADTATVDELFVRRQIAKYIYVNDLVAQNISTDRFTIASEDGGLSIAGNTMQFTNETGQVCMQLGQDTSGRFSFIICGPDGSILLDSTGLHPEAIADGLIKNTMIGDKQISKDKVDWADAGFTVDDSGKVWTNGASVKINDKALDAEFSAMAHTLDGNTATLETQRQQIQANSQGIQKLITDTTITKEDGATVSVKEQLNQTVEDVSGVRQSIHSLETNYNKVTGDLSSLESKQAEYTKTLDEFGVEFTTIKKDTDTIAKQVDELSSMTDTIELYGENVFITEGGVTKPSAITLTARPRNRAVIATWLLDNTAITSGISPDRTQLTLPFSALNGKKSVVIKAQNADGSIYDILTVYSVSDGKDAVSVVLTSDKGNIFRQGELTDTTITCRVYEGAQEIDGVKSYEWYTSADNGTTWTKIANASTKSIPLALNDIVTNKLIKCKVDI